MLLELTIRDFAIIDRLTIPWEAGLTVLSGETGAGKSIIVDAVGALLGDRLGSEAVRAGQQRASVEGVFALEGPGSEGPRELLAEHGLLEDDGQLILAREIARTGRSVARINGRAVPLSLLQQVGEHLVDVHGQSQHLSLLRPREHLEYLDRYAGLLDQRRALGQLVQRWRAAQAGRRRLQEEIRVVARERELLRHEVQEIESAELQLGEEQELTGQRQRLRHVERLRQDTEQALLALAGQDEQRGAVELLAEAGRLSGDAGRLDPSLAPAAEALERLATEADELSRDLRRYLDRLEADPAALEQIEARFLLLADLKRKYGETVEVVLEYLGRARTRLATAEHGEALLAELAEREAALRGEVAQAARDLSRARSETSQGLVEAVEQELRDLNLSSARLEVAQVQQADPDGVPWPVEADSERRVAVDLTGADRVELLFSANPGEPPRALGRIASGGELARVALALKAVLARVDRRATLIFDEVDVGVGGRSAPVVGQKLSELTRTHQVLCITHLPQVAAFADHHFVVQKRTAGQSTTTAVEAVAGEARIAELAAMLGGAGSRAAEANARELLNRSEAWRAARLGPRREPA